MNELHYKKAGAEHPCAGGHGRDNNRRITVEEEQKGACIFNYMGSSEAKIYMQLYMIFNYLIDREYFTYFKRQVYRYFNMK